MEHNELAQTWKAFNRFLPPTSRVQRGDRPPAVDDVVTLIRETQAEWQSHPRRRVFDRPLALSDQLVPTLSIHATLMTVLPDNDLFHAPLLYSVLQTVIKVGQILLSLSLSFCQRRCNISNRQTDELTLDS